MNKGLLLLLVTVSALMLMAFRSSEVNGFEVVLLQDTIFEPNLPDVEFRAITYNNFDGVTTAGFEVKVRKGELEITGVELYKASAELKINKRYSTFYPLQIHLGDSLRTNEVQCVKIYPRFPFTQVFYEEDSLVVHTDRGDWTICLPIDLRKQISKDIEHKYQSLFVKERENR